MAPLTIRYSWRGLCAVVAALVLMVSLPKCRDTFTVRCWRPRGRKADDQRAVMLASSPESAEPDRSDASASALDTRRFWGVSNAQGVRGQGGFLLLLLIGGGWRVWATGKVIQAPIASGARP
ncbi:MAG TPA: hypothetical protein DCS31_00005 [Candidatus Competibacteraceae bacterium]|nr:hypothetical protein [Candidatus Competibacteraceae bacterium]